MSRTEKWVQVYFKQGSKTLSEMKMGDGGWVLYYRGVYDSRDIMSDCVRPSWDSSGEYEIKIMAPGNDDSYFADMVVTCNKEYGNKIAYNINNKRFYNTYKLMREIKKLAKAEGGEYFEQGGRKYVKLGVK